MKLVLAVPQKRIAENADGYGQGKTSKDFRQGFYLPISYTACIAVMQVQKNQIEMCLHNCCKPMLGAVKMRQLKTQYYEHKRI
mgnify:FL=1